MVFFSLRDLSIWTNIFCFFFSLGRGCKVLTYVTDPLLRKKQSVPQTVSPVFSALCFVGTDLHRYRHASVAHAVCARVCVYKGERRERPGVHSEK